VINSTNLFEHIGIVASAVLGVATAVCAVLLVVKMASHLASDSLRNVRPSPKPQAAVRRTKRTSDYAELCRAVLETQASEPTAPPAHAADGELPVFARTAKPLEHADGTVVTS
jgi:hypothetical protein